MKINGNNLIRNNFIVKFATKSSRLKTGIIVLCKVIFTFGKSWKKTKTKQQWEYAFKGKKISHVKTSRPSKASNSAKPSAQKHSNPSLQKDNKTSVKSDTKTENPSSRQSEEETECKFSKKSEIANGNDGIVDDEERLSASRVETDEESQESEEYVSCEVIDLGAENFDELRVFAKEIIKKKKFTSENFEENLATASALALSLFTHREKLLTYEELKNKIALKAGMEDQEKFLKEKIFKRTFKSFMEAKEAQANAKIEKANNSSIRAVDSGVATKKLFGDEVFQVKLLSDKEEITYVAKIAHIGEGSFNEVYLAADILNGKIRVFRELHADYCGDGELLKRLKIENALQAELQKITYLRKGIIKIHATSETGSILSFANKGSLAEAITKQNLTNAEKQAAIRGVAKALCNLHQSGAVFGDFKSDNILLKQSKTGTIKIKLADFGGAYRPGKDTPPCMATPDYFSPEMLSKGPITNQATDLWAFGILMYEMKAYTTPKFHSDAYDLLKFDGRDSQEKIRTVQGLIQKGLATPSQYLDIYDPYDQIIIDLLQYEPGKRLALDEVCERLKDVPLESYS